jgi:nucleoside-diphosphate-sugar epimerase
MDEAVVAVTGPTGTFGFGLMPLLEADARAGRVVGVARRAFDPADHGWSKMTYRQGDVRDPDTLREAFSGCDVVIHLAFLVSGASTAQTMHEINVDGTRNAFRAAAEAGARRFVYASSVAAYGFHADNPVPITEDWPTRADHRFAYAAEKAELEALLHEESSAHPDTELFVLRPPIVLGPHAVGAKVTLPRLLEVGAPMVWHAIERLPVRVPVPVPATPVQFVDEADVGDAIVRCALGTAPAGAYNIAADDVITAVDVARELGVAPVALPAAPLAAGARILAALPRPGFVPPAAGWVTAVSQPAIADCAKAKELLGWQPAYSSLDTLRRSLGRP